MQEDDTEGTWPTGGDERDMRIPNVRRLASRNNDSTGAIALPSTGEQGGRQRVVHAVVFPNVSLASVVDAQNIVAYFKETVRDIAAGESAPSRGIPAALECSDRLHHLIDSGAFDACEALDRAVKDLCIEMDEMSATLKKYLQSDQPMADRDRVFLESNLYALGYLAHLLSVTAQEETPAP